MISRRGSASHDLRQRCGVPSYLTQLFEGRCHSDNIYSDNPVGTIVAMSCTEILLDAFAASLYEEPKSILRKQDDTAMKSHIFFASISRVISETYGYDDGPSLMACE